MADTKLSALTNLGGVPAATDELYINDSGVSKALQAQYLMDYQSDGALTTHFQMSLNNDGGTLKIRNIFNVGNNNTGSFTSMMDNSTAVAIATGTDASTAFTSGMKISSATPSHLILNAPTAAVVADQRFSAQVVQNDTGTALTILCRAAGYDVNGTNQQWQILEFRNATSAAQFNLNTTNITSGKTIYFEMWGYVP